MEMGDFMEPGQQMARPDTEALSDHLEFLHCEA